MAITSMSTEQRQIELQRRRSSIAVAPIMHGPLPGCPFSRFAHAAARARRQALNGFLFRANLACPLLLHADRHELRAAASGRQGFAKTRSRQGATAHQRIGQVNEGGASGDAQCTFLRRPHIREPKYRRGQPPFGGEMTTAGKAPAAARKSASRESARLSKINPRAE